MKKLFLLRHAKSSWSTPGLDDQLRPLNKRGLHDAPEMGRRFKTREIPLDLVLCSPAERARKTAELFVEAAGLSLAIIQEETDLYFSAQRTIEGIVQSQDDQFDSIMLVFHNPDITEFSNSIDMANRVSNIPTAGFVKLNCNIDNWCDWSVDNAEFVYFDYPKNLSN